MRRSRARRRTAAGDGDAQEKATPSRTGAAGSYRPDTTFLRYRRLWASMVATSCLVSIVPLVIMVVVNYYQYQRAFEEEVRHPIRLLASNARRSLHFFLGERLSALSFIVDDHSFDDLSDQKTLSRVFRHLVENHGGFVDIGLIDSTGTQRSYVGPYGLLGKSYERQDWFRETLMRGRFVSDVFMGYREFPHFAIAAKGVNDQGQAYILRATLNAEVLNRVCESEGARPSLDAFIINRRGVLQTPSKRFGGLLETVPIAVPPAARDTRIVEEADGAGRILVVGYSYIESSPFIYLALEQRHTLLSSWFNLRNKLLWFLAVSIAVIVVVVLAGTSYSVRRIREADETREALLHQVEYTAKMASIGRLAAGVAHEVNNPLAIINEKAGLLKDIITASERFENKERFLRAIDPILHSVERCSRITRRLLRFAKHIDVHTESINVELLIREVLGFLEKESAFRGLTINVDVEEGVPIIESDRGRLQQVFLNIINNAYDAVDDSGRIDIAVTREGTDHVRITISDNGVGIPREHLSQIFEPFFTTKQQRGTGLGLSITYGIVEKLGGRMTVDSQVGEWTRFAVILPVKPIEDRAGEGNDAGTLG